MDGLLPHHDRMHTHYIYIYIYDQRPSSVNTNRITIRTVVPMGSCTNEDEEASQGMIVVSWRVAGGPERTVMMGGDGEMKPTPVGAMVVVVVSPLLVVVDMNVGIEVDVVVGGALANRANKSG